VNTPTSVPGPVVTCTGVAVAAIPVLDVAEDGLVQGAFAVPTVVENLPLVASSLGVGAGVRLVASRRAPDTRRLHGPRPRRLPWRAC